MYILLVYERELSKMTSTNNNYKKHKKVNKTRNFNMKVSAGLKA